MFGDSKETFISSIIIYHYILPPFSLLLKCNNDLAETETNVSNNTTNIEKCNSNFSNYVAISDFDSYLSLIEDEEYPGCYYRLASDGSTKEWLNPPLISGVVYKTIEVDNGGNPIYVQLTDIGYLPNNTTMTFAFGSSGHTVNNIFDLEIIVSNDGSRKYKLPFINTDGEIVANAYFTGKRTVTLKSWADVSNYYATGYIKYSITE